MANKFDKNAKIDSGKYQGLAYDVTIKFNLIKEQKLGSRFRKQTARIENIINPELENELTQQTYEIEEKLNELRKLRDKMKKCKELFDKSKFEHEKIHLKVEELNSEAYKIINDIEDDLMKLRHGFARQNESEIYQETKKNARINLCLQLHEVATEIKEINMNFLMSDAKYIEKQKTTDWYSKALQDKEMAELMIDQMILDENDIEAIAKRRENDITNIINSFQKLSEQFKQLQTLVIEQGTILDRIDYNLMRAEERTKKSREQLTKADERSKSSTLATKVIIIEIILIIIFSFLLYLKYRKRYYYYQEPPVEDHSSNVVPDETLES